MRKKWKWAWGFPGANPAPPPPASEAQSCHLPDFRAAGCFDKTSLLESWSPGEGARSFPGPGRGGWLAREAPASCLPWAPPGPPTFQGQHFSESRAGQSRRATAWLGAQLHRAPGEASPFLPLSWKTGTGVSCPCLTGDEARLNVSGGARHVARTWNGPSTGTRAQGWPSRC